MSAPRFFVAGAHATGESIALEGADAHKVLHVLRLDEGDTIEVIDSAANVFAAALRRDGRVLRAQLLERRAQRASSGGDPRVTIAQGIPKGQKMDFIVEKLTELGAHAILPFESERSVVTGSGANKIERWRRLAKTAAQQCGRADVPAVADPCGFAELVARFGEFDRVLFPWELAAPAPLRDCLPALIGGATNVLAVIGPEGGFAHAEAEAATAAGARLISLGTRVLRTETAGLALLAILGYLTQDAGR